MNMEEFYRAVGGDYGETLSKLMQDWIILKYLGKFPDTPYYTDLKTSLYLREYEESLNHARELKKMSSSLGLGNLVHSVSVLCEDLEDENAEGNLDNEFSDVSDKYIATCNIIRKFVEENKNRIIY